MVSRSFVEMIYDIMSYLAAAAHVKYALDGKVNLDELKRILSGDAPEGVRKLVEYIVDDVEAARRHGEGKYACRALCYIAVELVKTVAGRLLGVIGEESINSIDTLAICIDNICSKFSSQSTSS